MYKWVVPFFFFKCKEVRICWNQKDIKINLRALLSGSVFYLIWFSAFVGIFKRIPVTLHIVRQKWFPLGFKNFKVGMLDRGCISRKRSDGSDYIKALILARFCPWHAGRAGPRTRPIVHPVGPDRTDQNFGPCWALSSILSQNKDQSPPLCRLRYWHFFYYYLISLKVMNMFDYLAIKCLLTGAIKLII